MSSREMLHSQSLNNENILISVDCCLFKEFHYVFTWSDEEILGIDVGLIKHEMKTYDIYQPTGGRLCLIDMKKEKNVEKFLNDVFIIQFP